MSLGPLRALLRVEARELRRHRLRSALVTLLVAVPVAAMVGGSALLRTVRPPPEGQGATTLAQAAPPESADSFETVVVFVAGGFGFFVSGLVIAAAFAVGLRRRQREIGLLRSCGAAGSLLGLALGMSTLGFAALGDLLGLFVGVLAAFGLHPFLDGWNGRANGPLEFEPIAVLGALALGFLAVLMAALLPAIGATRLAVRTALGGRRAESGDSRSWLTAGAFGLGIGLAALAFGVRTDGGRASVAVLAGSVLAVLGLGASSPAVLAGLAHLAGPLPLAWRLAVRDAGRFRARNGPVVTAVLAGMSVSVMLAVLGGAIEARIGPGVESDAGLFLRSALTACLLTGLAIVFIATTLSNVEASRDASLLWMLGADPRLLAVHSAARAGYLAALGGALALPAGLLPAAGLLSLANVELDFVWPWTTLFGVAFGLPALAYLGAWIPARVEARRLLPKKAVRT